MADDDQTFFKRDGRKNEKSWNLKRLTPAEVESTFAEIEDLVLAGGFAMVGLCAREGNQNIEDEYLSIASRLHNQYCVNVDTFAKEAIRFDDMPVMEDFYVNLCLLYRGIETAKLVDRVWDQPASNAAGGCSTYRTSGVQALAAMTLADTFPECVEVVNKNTKVGWFDGEARLDVRVQWKKALKLGQTNPQIRKAKSLL